MWRTEAADGREDVSPFVWGIVRSVERLRLILSFGEERKAMERDCGEGGIGILTTCRTDERGEAAYRWRVTKRLSPCGNTRHTSGGGLKTSEQAGHVHQHKNRYSG